MKDGQTVTKTRPGIAINTDHIGGTAVTSGTSTSAPKGLSVAVSKAGDRGSRPAKTAGANTAGDKNES